MRQLSMKSFISLTKNAPPQYLTHNWMNFNNNFPGKRLNIKLCLSESFFSYSLWLPWKHHFILTDEKLRWSTPLNVNMLKMCQKTWPTSSLDKVKQPSRQRVVTASIRMLKLMGCVVSKRCYSKSCSISILSLHYSNLM